MHDPRSKNLKNLKYIWRLDNSINFINVNFLVFIPILQLYKGLSLYRKHTLSKDIRKGGIMSATLLLILIQKKKVCVCVCLCLKNIRVEVVKHVYFNICLSKAKIAWVFTFRKMESNQYESLESRGKEVNWMGMNAALKKQE